MRFPAILKKSGKIILWLTGILIGILLIGILLLQLPSVQTYLTQKVADYLQKKLKTRVEVKGVNVGFPKFIVLNGVYMEDLQKDTLLYSGHLAVDVDLLALRKKKVDINRIVLENLTGHIYRAENDSSYNYDFIVKAFSDSATVTEKDTVATPWKISVNHIKLGKIFLTMRDNIARTNLLVNLGECNLDFETLDIEKSIYKLDKFQLAHTTLQYTDKSIPVASSEKEQPDSPAFTTGLQKLDLEDIHVLYQTNSQTLKSDIGKASMQADTLDIGKQQISINSFLLEKGFITYHREQQAVIKDKPAKPIPTGNPATPSKPWQVHIKDAKFIKNYLAFDDFNQTPKMKGLDFAHLFVSDFNAKAKDVVYKGTIIKANLEQLNFREKSGFEITKFQTQLTVTETDASITNLTFATPVSTVKGDIKAGYASLEKIADEYASAKIDAQIEPSHVAVADLLYFQPDVLATLSVRIKKTDVIDVESKIKGKVSDLLIENLKIHTFQQTSLALKGNISNLPDINNTTFTLAIDDFATTAGDIYSVLPPAMLPQNVLIPSKINLKAKLSGNTHDFLTKVLLTTSLGNIQTHLNLKTNNDFSNGSYRGSLQVMGAELGKLLRQEKMLGKCNLALGISGSGFKPEAINVQIDARVGLIEFQQYAYHNIIAEMKAISSLYSGKIEMADTNLNFVFNGRANLRKEIPAYIADLDLKNISWKALHFTDKNLHSRLQMKANLRFKELDNINGNVDLWKLAVVNEGKVYAVDSLLYVSFQEKEKTDIKIDSDILSGRFRGNINLSGFAGALTNHFNRYFTIDDSVKQVKAKPQQFDFELKLRNPAIFTDILIPDLDSLKPGLIKGNFDSQAARLNLDAEVFLLKYAGIKVDSFQLSINSDRRRLWAEARVAQVKHPSFHIFKTGFTTQVQNDTIQSRLTLLDSLQHQKYSIGTIAQSLKQQFKLHILQDSLLINARLWNINSDNMLLFTKKGFFIRDVDLFSGNQHLLLANVNEQPSSIKADFKNFELATLTTLIQSDTNWVTGLLNGDVQVFRQEKDTVFTSHLNIAKLTYEKANIGDISLVAEQKKSNRFDVNLKVTGNDNDLQIQGFYLTKGDNPLNFDVDCRKVQFANFAPFVKEQLKDFTGTGSGKIQVSGSPARPHLNGNFTFTNTSFNVIQLNNTFRIDRQTIYFDNAGLHFNSFALQDNQQQTATLTGDVLTRNYRFYRLRLHVSGNNFQVLNSTSEDNKMYYGKLFVNVEADIRGNSNKPVIAANLKVGTNSNLTYVVQQSEGTVAGQEGVIQWFDADVENDVFVKQMIKQTAPDSVRSGVKGFELTTNIEIDSTSTFAIVIDPIAGDQLKVKGETTLSLSIDPSGDIDLTGRYQVLSGTYNLSFFNLIKREFNLSRNSSITWSGDPLAANLDIQATYKVITSPLELMQNRLTTESDKQQYRQRLPFLVSLNMKGVLTHPEISFGLAMAEDKQNDLSRNVDIRLKEINTDPSELNKQVFALFLLQRFFAENPLESSSSSTETTVRTSVSKILTEQLNRFASQVKGIELQLDVNSFQDYSSGSAQGKTQLELGVSKNLFNDRLVVKVAGNVNLEGSSATSQQSLSDFVGDLRLEYKLTKDGRLRITGFRQRSFDLVSGELIETGGGIIYIRDYNAFRELFSSKSSE
jgi:hypothetical protein